MSAAGLRCPGCGSSNIVDDDLYCQAQLVCVDCGSVVSEGTLADDPVGGTDVSYSRTTEMTRKPCLNLIKGLERVKEICRILRVSSEIEDLALTHFRQAYEHESFINVTLQRKELLAGCCVFVSCRQRDWPITLGTISCLLNADQTLVGGVYQNMMKILNIQAPFINVTDVIEAHVQEYKISTQHVPEELAEDSKVLSKRAVALVELAGDSWIVTGRKPLPIMMAATYLAWQSLNPNKHRLRLSLDKFCQLAKVQKRKPATTRITELKEVLCKLGRELPWVREPVTQNDVVPLVGDILEHRHTLLTRALRTHERAMEADCTQTFALNSLTEEVAPSQISESRNQTANASSVVQPCPNTRGENQEGDGDENHQSEDPEPNWGKRVLFAPPCVLHAKMRRVERPVQNVTGDEEISDSEIDSYIRSPQEVRDFAQMQKMASCSDSGKS
ncbi:transcription factor IIIB 50 kDa subunit [Girardinichthys multiradiatus]|uniref:transcription factor IIIB 50 kDa subunit n=1 Tax=Girardinichthys multiradiatus TaxID=208333 RepID=UPI001FABE0C4|nr:transcription factor IIIB 50 kDa subunit [Girardinichthys multiradiatus]